MGYRGFGVLGCFFSMAQVAVIDRFLKVGGTLFEMLFLQPFIDDRAGERMFQRGAGMFDQNFRMAGFAVFDGGLGMFERGGGMFLGKGGGAGE